MGYRPKLSKEIYEEEQGRIIANTCASIVWLVAAGALAWYADYIALTGPRHETGVLAIYGASTLLGLMAVYGLYTYAREHRENDEALKRREQSNYDYWVQGTGER